MERIHKLSAAFVFAFLCLHFANHFAGLMGVEFHIQFMQTLRALYYVPAVEYAVLAAFAVQILTGLPLIWEIWTEKKDVIHQLQAASGAVMTLFIVTHVVAVLVGRYVLNLDTNFHFAAAGLMSSQWKPVFLGYYGAGVFSLFVHFGCIAYDIFKKSNKGVGWMLLLGVSAAGAYVTWTLLQIYSGQVYPVEVPAAYAEMFK
jgi:hypothetical protein